MQWNHFVGFQDSGDKVNLGMLPDSSRYIWSRARPAACDRACARVIKNTYGKNWPN